MRGAKVRVVYVLRRNAKAAKTELEQRGMLHKCFRMTAPPSCSPHADTCIAIPIHDEFSLQDKDDPQQRTSFLEGVIVEEGTQLCPYSTSVLGNGRTDLDTSSLSFLTRVQQGLVWALEACSSQALSAPQRQEMLSRVTHLPVSVCPKKLEYMGDDRTLVIPRKAFDVGDESFRNVLRLVMDVNVLDTNSAVVWRNAFWKSFASTFNSTRVVRRGDIDPNSKIRESGHRLLWPFEGVPTETGPDSPGWITVTEQGIAQSFDMTRVMFSRGNITEKIRFGTRLVQPDDVVLDMYAGIGYYTLPALIHGKARHVVACEWNPNAAHALKYNLQASGVSDRATVFVGDSRATCRQYALTNRFDRISLGLLPSSEGGWRTAVKALRFDRGGWLHIHGNVPDVELGNWSLWLCSRLLTTVEHEDWVVLCSNIERVKSFAPQIHHYVADVFVGPLARAPMLPSLSSCRAGVVSANGAFQECPGVIQPPSCALSQDGILNQKWMRDCSIEDL